MKGIDLTNNATERALRPAVLWRKGIYGTQSVGGSRFVSLSVPHVRTIPASAPALLDCRRQRVLGESACPKLLPSGGSE
ncbi:MAG: hypothetical protein EI684_04935 [Candidatus Viridilinea halotolerans]|uniref:Transposase n=1 Tax=Candidatus Viridilinea halotolerans TaxID=2491704 RepID=A0A426U5U5_9CHLR|nr:MAG: hypothetical protein EI684_04935 [Candidatus Viridilinea halotolerans]